MLRMVPIETNKANYDALFLKKVTYPNQEFILLSFPFNEDFHVRQLTIVDAMNLRKALDEIIEVPLLPKGRGEMKFSGN